MTKMGSTYGRFCIKFPQSRMKGEFFFKSIEFELKFKKKVNFILLSKGLSGGFVYRYI
jgi:hypothetical protein